MDDTISRAAALTAICEDGTQLERQGQYSMTMAERKQRDTDILSALPPAQPSVSKEEMVGDAVSRQGVLRLLNAVPSEEFATKAMLIGGVNALPSVQQGWIPVTDRLPEMTDTYLVRVGINENGEGMHTEVRTADWNAVWKEWYVHECTFIIIGEVTEWIPIPLWEDRND